MPSAGVGLPLDPGEEYLSDLVDPIQVRPRHPRFPLEDSVPALDRSVVPGLHTATRGKAIAHRRGDLFPGLRGVLAALIGMQEYASPRSPPEHAFDQGVDDQFEVGTRRNVPVNRHTGV